MIELGGVYEKIECNGKVHYILQGHVATVLKDLIKHQGMGVELSLMQFSEFVVDKNANTLLKCRYSLEQLFDKVVL